MTATAQENMDMILDLINDKKAISMSLIQSLKLDKAGNDSLARLINKRGYLYHRDHGAWLCSIKQIDEHKIPVKQNRLNRN